MLCQCPKLTPLQTRLLASIFSLALLGLIYWSLSNPHFAYAAELDIDGSGRSRGGADHNWHRLEQERLEAELFLEDAEAAQEDGSSGQGVKEATKVLRRADAAPSAINANDSPNNLNIIAGQTTVWEYARELLEGKHANVGVGLPRELAGKVVDVSHHQELRKRSSDHLGGPESMLELRQVGDREVRDVYISINTCLQPSYNGSGTQTAAPPQLTLYVAMTTALTTPGPKAPLAQQRTIPLQQGYANVTIKANTTLYLAVHAPALPSDFTGGWNYDIAVSIDGFYHRSQADPQDPFLFFIDADTNNALLVTDNLTQADNGSQIYNQWLNLSTPFSMFASQVNDTSTLGVEQSYCGLQRSAQIQSNQDDPQGTVSHVQMGMTNRGLGNKPKQQFYLSSLNGSTLYQGWLTMDGNSTNSGAGVVGGGGKVWSPVPFTTKQGNNCALLFNLTFCSEVAYAVPSNSKNYPNVDDLAAVYDHYAAELYKNFTYSLMQIPCSTTADAQYSLAKNCTDCATAYKEWLCAVSIPRCEDFSNPAAYLQPRNVGQAFISTNSTAPASYLPASYLNNQTIPMSDAPTLDGSPAFQQTYNSSLATKSSRNIQIIDDMIMPGPYKEVLPCEDLCFSLMQSCPAALQFRCPLPGRGLEVGYGKRNPNGSLITCSYLGAVYYLNGAGSVKPEILMATVLAIGAGLALFVW